VNTGLNGMQVCPSTGIVSRKSLQDLFAREPLGNPYLAEELAELPTPGLGDAKAVGHPDELGYVLGGGLQVVHARIF